MYFLNEKEKFLQQCNNMGLDMYACQDFLEQKGICEKDVNIVLDNCNNPNYRNVLKPMMYQQPPGVQ